MKINKISYISLLLMTMSHYTMAGQSFTSLDTERDQVIHQYILYLENADYVGISALFVEGGIVISTSAGNVDAKEFFYSFLPQIAFASTEFHQKFINNEDNNRYAARFHFNFKLKDGETGDGEYIDEFIFANNSAKLTSVYMFENLKFNVKN